MTPTPTPRTDAIAHRGLGSVAYIAEMTEAARQLERENQTFRAAQKACEDCDAPRVDRIAELERELSAERALADRLAGCMQHLAAYDWFIDGTHSHSVACSLGPNRVREALVAWKEARREQ